MVSPLSVCAMALKLNSKISDLPCLTSGCVFLLALSALERHGDFFIDFLFLSLQLHEKPETGIVVQRNFGRATNVWREGVCSC